MPGGSQSSVYEELVQSRFLCKTVHSLQRAFFHLHRTFFSSFWDWASKNHSLGWLLLPHLIDEEWEEIWGPVQSLCLITEQGWQIRSSNPRLCFSMCLIIQYKWNYPCLQIRWCIFTWLKLLINLGFISFVPNVRIMTGRQWYLLSLWLPGSVVGAALPYLTGILRNRGAIWAAAGFCEPVGIIHLHHSGSLEGSDLPKSLTRQTLQLDHRVSLLPVCSSRQFLWRVSFSELMS